MAQNERTGCDGGVLPQRDCQIWLLVSRHGARITAARLDASPLAFRHMPCICSCPVLVTVTCSAVVPVQSVIWMRVPSAPLGAFKHLPTTCTWPVPVLVNWTS